MALLLLRHSRVTHYLYCTLLASLKSNAGSVSQWGSAYKMCSRINRSSVVSMQLPQNSISYLLIYYYHSLLAINWLP